MYTQQRGCLTALGGQHSNGGRAPAKASLHVRASHILETHQSATQIVVHGSPTAESPGVLVEMHPEIRISGIRISNPEEHSRVVLRHTLV